MLIPALPVIVLRQRVPRQVDARSACGIVGLHDLDLHARRQHIVQRRDHPVGGALSGALDDDVGGVAHPVAVVARPAHQTVGHPAARGQHIVPGIAGDRLRQRVPRQVQCQGACRIGGGQRLDLGPGGQDVTDARPPPCRRSPAPRLRRSPSPRGRRHRCRCPRGPVSVSPKLPPPSDRVLIPALPVMAWPSSLPDRFSAVVPVADVVVITSMPSPAPST